MLGYPGSLIRVVPGSDPTNTALTEVYEPPLPGYGPRGGDVDANGVFWVALSSGHLGQFDRAQVQGDERADARPASIAPKAGRCTSSPGRSCAT